MTHEIAAAWIVGGFIVAYSPSDKWNFCRGFVIIVLATLIGLAGVY